MKLRRIILVFLIITTIVIGGCTTTETYKEVEDVIAEETDNGDISKEAEEVEKAIEEVKEEPPHEIDLEKIKPNEAGQIMVLMYHSIAEPEAEWSRTPDNFRRDLQYLYDKGYRPISLKDYVEGNITTEAGFTPIVLTFDDGWQNNFNIIEGENGEIIIDPNCAVAILVDFHEKHKDFPLEATFFINDNIPFGQAKYVEYKLKYIVEKGMDIGNHTATHVNFTNADGERIQKEIAGIVELVNKYLPGYEVNTLALPFGSRPKDDSLSHLLKEGSFNGVSYNNIAILNVGWDPYKSPYHVDFNPLAIHRVRGSDLEKYTQGVGMYDWLDRFDRGERTRFISDGNPDIITIPANFEEVIDKNRFNKKIIAY